MVAKIFLCGVGWLITSFVVGIFIGKFIKTGRGNDDL